MTQFEKVNFKNIESLGTDQVLKIRHKIHLIDHVKYTAMYTILINTGETYWRHIYRTPLDVLISKGTLNTTTHF